MKLSMLAAIIVSYVFVISANDPAHLPGPPRCATNSQPPAWRSRAGATDGSARPARLGVAPGPRQATPGNCRSALRARERDEDIPRPTPCLERGGPALVQVRCVVACRQRVAVQGIDPLPRLPLKGPFRMLEVNGRRLRARVHPDGSRVEGLAVLGLDLEAVAGKGEPMSDNVIGCFAVAFRLCCSPGPLQFLLGFLGQLREGEMDRSESQTNQQNDDGFNRHTRLFTAVHCRLSSTFSLPLVHRIWHSWQRWH